KRLGTLAVPCREGAPPGALSLRADAGARSFVERAAQLERGDRSDEPGRAPQGGRLSPRARRRRLDAAFPGRRAPAASGIDAHAIALRRRGRLDRKSVV